MEESGATMRKWEDLDTDILVQIFQTFDIFELTSGIAHVCSAWRMACCDPLLWKTLDLSALESNFIRIPLEPYVYVHGQSDKEVTRVLKIALDLSRGSIQTLIFHFNLYLSDEQLTYTAERYLSKTYFLHSSSLFGNCAAPCNFNSIVSYYMLLSFLQALTIIDIATLIVDID